MGEAFEQELEEKRGMLELEISQLKRSKKP